MIHALDLPEPKPPSAAQKQVEFPEDLTILDPRELGEQLTVWTQMLNYASYQRALVENDNRVFKARYSRAVDEKLSHHSKVEERVSEKKAKARTDPATLRLADSLEEGEAVYSLLNSLCEVFERNYSAISRDISRRVGSPPE